MLRKSLELFNKLTAKKLINYHLKLLSTIYGSLFPLIPSNSEQEFLDCKSLEQFHWKIGFAKYLHVILRLSQGFSYVVKYRVKMEELPKDLLIYIIMWTCISFLGVNLLIFLSKNISYFALLVNQVLTLDKAYASKQIKALLFVSVGICVGFIFFFTPMLIFIPLDPLSALIDPIISEYSPILANFVGKFMTLFEIWDGWLVMFLGSLFCYEGLFAGYLVISRSSGLLVSELRKFNFSLLNASAEFESFIKKYNCLRLYTTMINDCLRKYIGMPCKFLMICFSPVFAVGALHNRLRSTLSPMGKLCCEFFTICMWLMTSIGCSFPGKANETSKTMFAKWKHVFGWNIYQKVHKTEKKLIRLQMRAWRDIRFMIGSANYYERTTSLNILSFDLQITVNLMLLL